MPSRRTILRATTLGLAAGVAGCLGDGDDGNGGDTTPTSSPTDTQSGSPGTPMALPEDCPPPEFDGVPAVPEKRDATTMEAFAREFERVYQKHALPESQRLHDVEIDDVHTEGGGYVIELNGEAEQVTPEEGTPTATPQPLTPTNNTSDDNQSGPVTVQTRPGSNPEGNVTAITRPGSNPDGTVNATATATGGGGGDGLPSRQETALGLLAVVGLAIGVRRSKAGQRAYRALWLYYQPRDEPAADVERAFQRLMYHLGSEHYRTRHPDETVREYLDTIDADERAREVATIRERARYGGTVTEEQADRAVSLVDEMVR